MITGQIIKRLPPLLRSKIENDYELRNILGNINWLTAGIIFKDIVGLFVIAWVARYLGPEQFGLMNYAIAFVVLFSSLSTLGLDNIVIRNILLRPDQKFKYIESAFILKLLGSLLMLLLSSVVIYILQPENSLVRIFVLIVGFGYIFKAFDVIDFFFQSKVEARYSVYARSLSFIVVSLIKIILILTQAPLISFILMFSLDLLVTAILLIYFYFKREAKSIFRKHITVDTMKELIRDSWPLFLSGIAVTIYSKIDQIMIGNLLGDRELGLYSSAAKLSEAWYFIPAVIMSSVFPSILRAKKKSKELYLKRMQLLYDVFVIFTLVIAFLVTIASPLIIRILYGNEYIEAANVLSIHIWAGPAVFLGVASGSYLVAENLTKVALMRTFVGAVINIVSNIILIPSFGIEGAAISTLISYSFATIFVIFPSDARIVGLSILKSFNIFRLVKLFQRKAIV